jgi:acetyltransferase-like isoleucine patch superfamily enzyme
VLFESSAGSKQRDTPRQSFLFLILCFREYYSSQRRQRASEQRHTRPHTPHRPRSPCPLTMSNIGKYSYGAPTIKWENADGHYTCGKFCSIAGNVKIYLGGNHRTDWVSTYPFGHTHQDKFTSFNGAGHPSTKGNVVVGNDVWIGDNVTIMSGVTIGDGAVVANNSHVVKNVEPYSITGGNPAKLIKLRFSKEQIDALLEIKWWDWEDSKINTVCPLLCSPDVDEFIKAAKNCTE